MRKAEGREEMDEVSHFTDSKLEAQKDQYLGLQEHTQPLCSCHKCSIIGLGSPHCSVTQPS